MGTLANTRDSSLGTTSGAVMARGGGAAAPSAAPTGWTVPTGVAPLLIGLGLAVGLLVYWDRRVVFKK